MGLSGKMVIQTLPPRFISRVMETRPLSKTKRWRVAEIVEKAK